MVKKLGKDVIGLTKVGVGLGIGSTMVGKIGGDTSGFTTASGFMGIMGTVAGAGTVLRQTKKLKLKNKRR